MPVEPFASFLPLGAIIQEFCVDGTNIVLNFPTIELYQKYNTPYFGETIGRVANRISNARINNLNGQAYQLAANNGPNCLHGGKQGWGKHMFEGPATDERNGQEAILFKHVSRDEDEGFPGTVELRVWYTTRTEQEQGCKVYVLEVEYEAELVGDENVQETVVAVTNHSYFNLGNLPTIEGTEVSLSTDLYQVVNQANIPTGPLARFPGVGPNNVFTLGPNEPDIDHCFVLDTKPDQVPIDTRSRPLQRLGTFYHPASKIHLDVHSTEPAFQFYTGKYIDVPAVNGLQARGPRSGFCIEPSRYVDAINVDSWRGMVILKRGQRYGSKFAYRAWKKD